MRLQLALAILLFCARIFGQQAPEPSIFEQQSARFYAVSGMERVKMLDSIYPFAIGVDPKRTIGLLEETSRLIESSAIPADEKLVRSAKVLLKMGDCFKAQYKYPEAFSCYEKALSLGARRDSLNGKKNPDRAWAMVSLGKLTGSSLNSSTNFDKAFEYFNKAETAFLACGDTAGLIFNYEMMSSVAFEFHHADLAVKYGRAGLSLAQSKNKRLVPTFLRRIGQSFLLTEQPDSTIFYLDQIGEAFDSPENLVRKATIYKFYGEAYFMKKNWEKVVEYCRLFEELGKRTDIPAGIYSPMYYLYADACYQSGRYKEAYEHMERFKFLEDSLSTIVNDKTVAGLREKFEADQKEKEIALLTAKNEVQKLWRWLFASILGLASLGGWFFFKWLLKKKRAREAELMAENTVLQNRFDRLLNLHFEEKLETTGNPDDDFLPNLFSILEKNLANEHFNIEELPQGMGVSRAQFFKKTKELTGKTPAELLRELRMQKAKRMLVANQTTVAEVAYATGFGSPDSFGRAFKSFFGENPSAVRRSGQN